jgi:hypothetical protein
LKTRETWPRRPLFERALALYETVLGPDHPDTGTSLSNLACVLHDAGQAGLLFRRAIAKKTLGPNDVRTQRYCSHNARCSACRGPQFC